MSSLSLENRTDPAQVAQYQVEKALDQFVDDQIRRSGDGEPVENKQYPSAHEIATTLRDNIQRTPSEFRRQYVQTLLRNFEPNRDLAVRRNVIYAAEVMIPSLPVEQRVIAYMQVLELLADNDHHIRNFGRRTIATAERLSVEARQPLVNKLEAIIRRYNQEREDALKGYGSAEEAEAKVQRLTSQYEAERKQLMMGNPYTTELTILSQREARLNRKISNFENSYHTAAPKTTEDLKGRDWERKFTSDAEARALEIIAEREAIQEQRECIRREMDSKIPVFPELESLRQRVEAFRTANKTMDYFEQLKEMLA